MASRASNQVREFNRARVLGAVRDGTATSRGELCTVTGLSRTTVTALVLDLVGAGALDASDEVIAVSNRLNAGCAKALLGKAALPDDLPWVTGCIGLR